MLQVQLYWKGLVVPKIKTATHLLKLAMERPASFPKAVSYGLKYGLVGLRNRFHDEIVLDNVEVPNEVFVKGSVGGPIKFSIVMPVYNVDLGLLGQAIESVTSQTYDNWELCIADDCSTDSKIKNFLESRKSNRIKVVFLDKNEGISGASNAAAKLAEGDYLCLMDNDDLLKPNALAELYMRLAISESDIIYTDNDIVDSNGLTVAAFYKPDWSPDLMLSQMYIGHLLAFKRTLFNEVGGFDSEFDGSQDYDIFLRMLLKNPSIDHISKPLYSWRAVETSTAANPGSKPYAQIAGKNAIQRYLDYKYGKGVCEACETDSYFVYDVRYPIPESVLASIIIPTKDHVDDLKAAIDSIFEKTEYKNFEIIILNNNSEERETASYFRSVVKERSNITVIDAPFAFNWSKLNNLGIDNAKGDVFVFLNNDVEVLDGQWLTRLVENAIRDDIGVVGGLLTYPDGTIQHAGVVLGMGGWADHVYKGHPAVHCGNPFVSPMVNRNVSAVTGACYAISKKRIDCIGRFDEDFIVCGSDVELCLRAMKKGYSNLYTPYVRLTHFESKTRDAKNIPDIDFKLSAAMYREYIAAGDPFYNKNLDYMSCSPRVLTQREKLQRNVRDSEYVSIQEIRPIHFIESPRYGLRLNLYIPSINGEDIYGGISTALKYFQRLVSDLACEARIIVIDGEPREGEAAQRFPGYEFVEYGKDSNASFQIVSAVNRENGFIPVKEGDWFVATAWWTAFCHQEEIKRCKAVGNSSISFNPMIYLIQDYEPGFYAWNTCHILAQSTYSNEFPTIAIFNSSELSNYFKNRGYAFTKEFCFEPSLNATLKQALDGLDGKATKRKQILVYGRPGTERNAFRLVVESLRQWVRMYPEQGEWTLLSAGEDHPPMYLDKGRYLVSVGKLSLEDYAELLAETYAGISLMVSPHPSYPPLEMATFGVKTITNAYVGKDLADFSSEIVSVKTPTPFTLAEELCELCATYSSSVSLGHVRPNYLNDADTFSFASTLEEYIRSQRKRN